MNLRQLSSLSRSSRAVGRLAHVSSRSYTRPSIAPKPTVDIRHIRNAPGLYEQNCISRNYKQQSKNSWRILELHDKLQLQQRHSRNLRERNNVLRRQLANPATRQDPALLEQAKQLKAELAEFDAQDKQMNDEMEELALALPNLSSLDTPEGDIPAVREYINEHPDRNPSPSDRVWRNHVHVGSELDMLDFTASATTSGWGWYFLKNEAALLEQALISYALTVAMKRGWKVVSPPSIVYSHIAHACGFQPRDQNDEQQIYAITQPEKDKNKPTLCLAGTAEIPFAGMKANTVIEEADLPLKIIGASRCYRAEAGARGIDTKGLYRVHEFTKVEMFAWTMPDNVGDDHFSEPTPSPSAALFDEMVAIQKEILQSLGLHCRVLEMPTTELGASATRKIDIEAFFPSRREKDEGWGEVTSASICTNYQTRRLATRVKTEKFGRKHEWPYTVNGTALAVPRVLAAIMEAGWEESSKSMLIPEVLRPFMGGLERIERSSRISIQ
jgi:seryl-tRNA synthetase